MTKDEAMRMALNALEIYGVWTPDVEDTIEALHAALAQPESEPMAWVYSITGALFDICPPDADEGEFLPLYPAPPQREWQVLTGKEIEDCLEMSIHGTCRAIEAKLKEKNNG